MTKRDLNVSLRKKETNEILNIYPLTKSENVYLSDEDTLKTYLKNQDSLNSIFVNDSKKLKKIEDGAQRNQNAISIIKHNDQIYESDKENGSVELISGDNVSIEIVGSKIKFSVKERTIQKASANRDGLMSKEDYTKLFNIEDNANNYVHPDSGIKEGNYLRVSVDKKGHVISGNNSTLTIEEGGTGVTSVEALKEKLEVQHITIDSEVTQKSLNPVSSAGIFNALDKKASINHGNHVPDSSSEPSDFSFLKEGNVWESLPNSTLSGKGIVQLSNKIDGESETVAATEKAVNDVKNSLKSELDDNIKAVRDVLNNKVDTNTLSSYATTEVLSNHSTDKVIHITASERTKWNDKSDVKLDTVLSNTSNNAISNKAVKDALDNKVDTGTLTNYATNKTLSDHTSNTTSHITAAERTKWNAKSDVKLDTVLSNTSNNAISNKAVKDALDNKVDTDTLNNHISDTTSHITAAERTKWNNVLVEAKSYTDEKYGSIEKIDFYILESGVVHTDIKNPSANLIYLEKAESSIGYESWIYRNGTWVNIGSDDINLNNYYNKTEIKKLLSNNKITVDTVLSNTSTNAISNKAVKDALDNKVDTDTLSNYATTEALSDHTSNTTSHITASERTKWNDKSDVKLDTVLSNTSNNAISNKAVKDALDNKVDTDTLSNYATTEALSDHTSNTTSHITAAERTKWNNAAAGTVTVDTALNSKSNNPISNSAVSTKFESIDSSLQSMNSSISNKVTVISGKGLSTNDLTNTLKSNYDSAYTHSTSYHAPSNAERNIIVGIQKNGTDLTVNSTTRKINISVPTAVSELNNDKGYITASSIPSSLPANGGTAENSNHVYSIDAGGFKRSMNMNWIGNDGQPPWLWGGSDGTNMYVYNPSNFNVNYARKTTGVIDYGDSNKTIQIGYGGAGISGDAIKYIAGYTTGNGSDVNAKIKDVSKDALKSWLGLGSLAYSSATIPTIPSSLPANGGTATYANYVYATSHQGSWYQNSQWDGTYFQTNYKNGDTVLPMRVGYSGYADSAGSANNSTTVNGHSVDADVPSGAKFTDTVYTHPKHSQKTSGFYKFAVDAEGHVSSSTAVTKSDITSLGIASNSVATTSENGLMSSTQFKNLKDLISTNVSVMGTSLPGAYGRILKLSSPINGSGNDAYAIGIDTNGRLYTYFGNNGSTTAKWKSFLLQSDIYIESLSLGSMTLQGNWDGDAPQVMLHGTSAVYPFCIIPRSAGSADVCWIDCYIVNGSTKVRLKNTVSGTKTFTPSVYVIYMRVSS